MHREIRFDALGRTHSLRFTYRAFYMLDDQHGYTVSALWRGLTTVSIKALAAGMLCGLEGARVHDNTARTPYTLDDVFGILQEVGHRRVAELVAEAVNLGLADPKGDAPPPAPTAPSAP